MGKQKILGLDLGSNSVGWALLESEGGDLKGIVDAGVRIFNRAVEKKTPISKKAKRREKRLARRVVQRRARRKKRMLNYLIKLNFLPETLSNNPQPETILNEMGSPYLLRAKALDHKLSPFELGRVFLHLVQRRGFLSSKKTLLGDMADDPDVLEILSEEQEDSQDSNEDKEETAFKQEISEFRKTIEKAGCRTLGEYLAKLDHHSCKRNRNRKGVNLRTDRKMYQDELELIWKEQCRYHNVLDDKIKQEIENIIFFQRPVKLKPGSQGKCSLEPLRKRARMGRLEVQKFRYLQDINNLQYRSEDTYQWDSLDKDQRKKLTALFKTVQAPTFGKIKKTLNLKGVKFNLETDVKNLKGNSTAVKVRGILPEWDDWNRDKQYALIEDLITINKKSVLKKRLTTHWNLPIKTAVGLCMIELEPGHSNLSSKAIKKLLPYLQQGQVFSEARVSAGYDYKNERTEKRERLGPSPEIPNPIVEKGLRELRRLVNAVIAHHGKPDAIRVEMARDLEMNTQKYKRNLKQQKANTKSNEEAAVKYREMREQNPHPRLSEYPNKDDKLKYRLWKDQDYRCIYSNTTISLSTLFRAEIEIDHIIPYSLSLDDSYMNKVVCLAGENRNKGQRTPIDAYGGEGKKWNRIVQTINKWSKNLAPKKERFHKTTDEAQDRDFLSSQLNDTRYICREALAYLGQLGVEVTTTKGYLVSWMRRLWGLESLIGETDLKERTDHRHHTIDAVIIACIDRKFHKTLVEKIAEQERLRKKANRTRIPEPWKTIRKDIEGVLDKIIVSHSPQRKPAGKLHEETGAGFIEGIGTIYRKDLDNNFTLNRAKKKIIDPAVKEIVLRHLEEYGNKPKDAFAEGVTVYHKDGKTPINKVRIKQSKTNETELRKNKFGVKNSRGEIFKWMSFGNFHHVEIIKRKDSGNYSGEFVTMMEARRRALTNTKQAKRKRITPEPVVKRDHGSEYQFLMALHKNDLVKIKCQEEYQIYRVQKLNKFTLRLHTASTENNKDETMPDGESSIPALMGKEMKLHKVNVLGKPLHD